MREDVDEITEGSAKSAQHSSSFSSRLPHSFLWVSFIPNQNDFIREPFILIPVLRKYQVSWISFTNPPSSHQDFLEELFSSLLRVLRVSVLWLEKAQKGFEKWGIHTRHQKNMDKCPLQPSNTGQGKRKSNVAIDLLGDSWILVRIWWKLSTFSPGKCTSIQGSSHTSLQRVSGPLGKAADPELRTPETEGFHRKDEIKHHFQS